MSHRHHGSFGHLVDHQRGRFDLLGAQAVTGDIDDVIDAAEDAVITILGFHGGIAGQVGPVAPILAFRILAVAGIVVGYEAVAIAPDGLERARPRVLDADVARLARAAGHLFGLIV